jgi:hypothetical protein
MHSIDYTVNRIHKRPGGYGNGGVCPSVPTQASLPRRCLAVRYLVKTNERFASDASDLDMT